MTRLPETGGPGTSAEPQANSPENQLPRNSRQLTLLAKRTAKKRKEEKKREKGDPIRTPPITAPQAPRAPAHPRQNSAALRRLSAAHTMPWIYCSQDALQSVKASRTAQQAPRARLYPAAPDSGCFRGVFDFVSCCSQLFVTGCCTRQCKSCRYVVVPEVLI